MTYALAFAPEARVAWRALPVELQEVVLDELDRLAADPLSLPRGATVRDIIHQSAGTRHYVFLQVSVSHARQTLDLYTAGYHARRIDG
jgi:hypothetical protein